MAGRSSAKKKNPSTPQVEIKVVSSRRRRGGRPRLSQMRQSHVSARRHKLSAMLTYLQRRQRRAHHSLQRHKRAAHHAGHLAGRASMMRVGHLQHAKHYKARAKSLVARVGRASARSKSHARYARAAQHATVMHKRIGKKVIPKLIKAEKKHLSVQKKHLKRAQKIEEHALGRIDARIQKVEAALQKLKSFRVSAAQRARAGGVHHARGSSSIRRSAARKHKSGVHHARGSSSIRRSAARKHAANVHTISAIRRAAALHTTARKHKSGVHHARGSSSIRRSAARKAPKISVIVQAAPSQRPRRAAAALALSRMLR